MVTRLSEEEISSRSKPNQQISKEIENFLFIQIHQQPIGEYQVVAAHIQLISTVLPIELLKLSKKQLC